MTSATLKRSTSKRIKARVKPPSRNRAKRPEPGDDRRESKAVAEFNRWLLENAASVEKWARQNTKRLTGREII